MREDADRNVDVMFRRGLIEESAPDLGRFQFTGQREGWSNQAPRLNTFLYSHLDSYSVLAIGVCAPLNMALKTEVIKVLEYVLSELIGYVVRTPTS